MTNPVAKSDLQLLPATRRSAAAASVVSFLFLFHVFGGKKKVSTVSDQSTHFSTVRTKARVRSERV